MDEFGYELTGDELRRVIALSPEERLEHFVGMADETAQIWTISVGEELLVLADEDEKPFIVVFPHPEYGQDWFSSTELEDVDLVAVATPAFVDEILPGLQQNEIDVLVFPTSEGEGTLLAPSELREAMAGGGPSGPPAD